MSYTTPHLSMLDTTTQTIAVADTPQVITFNTTNFAKKIAVTSSSRFTVNEAGDYIIMLSVQVTSSSANKMLDIWFRKSGTDVTNSNIKINLVNTNDEKLQTLNATLSLTAGQYIEVWMSGSSTDLSLPSYSAGVTPTRPVTPSVFLTIERLN